MQVLNKIYYTHNSLCDCDFWVFRKWPNSYMGGKSEG